VLVKCATAAGSITFGAAAVQGDAASATAWPMAVGDNLNIDPSMCAKSPSGTWCFGVAGNTTVWNFLASSL